MRKRMTDIRLNLIELTDDIEDITIAKKLSVFLTPLEPVSSMDIESLEKYVIPTKAILDAFIKEYDLMTKKVEMALRDLGVNAPHSESIFKHMAINANIAKTLGARMEAANGDVESIH